MLSKRTSNNNNSTPQKEGRFVTIAKRPDGKGPRTGAVTSFQKLQEFLATLEARVTQPHALIVYRLTPFDTRNAPHFVLHWSPKPEDAMELRDWITGVKFPDHTQASHWLYTHDFQTDILFMASQFPTTSPPEFYIRLEAFVNSQQDPRTGNRPRSALATTLNHVRRLSQARYPSIEQFFIHILFGQPKGLSLAHLDAVEQLLKERATDKQVNLFTYKKQDAKHDQLTEIDLTLDPNLVL